MFQQNRDIFRSTHVGGGTEFDEDELDFDGGNQVVVVGKKHPQHFSVQDDLEPEMKRPGGKTSAWYRLNPPALCGVRPWGIAGATDPAAAAGAIGLGFEPHRPGSARSRRAAHE